jgi:sigma-B regulation protein RsbU (phosphoserine phosphatase)
MQKTSATLLIIDDDEVVRASLAAYLEDSGFSVLQAGNGLQGLQVFERDQPDLVICDLRMPQMGGLELIRQVTELAPQTPVIVVSGAGVMNDAVEALRLGAADYLIKPLEDLAVLEHSVRRALDRARLLLENQRYREKLETANRELEASLNLLQEDQNAGRQVQMNMLPVSPWTIDEFQFAHQIIPSLYLSGDFVDYFRVDERRVAFYLADVSGHGASSAFVTVLLKFMTTRLLFESKRNGTLPEFTPSQVLGHINRGLISCKLGKHVTMVGGVIDEETGLLTYSIGGHLPLPVLYTPDSVRYLEGRGLPVGLFNEATYEDHILELPPAFSLTLMSDGILDLLPEPTLKEKEAALPQRVRSAGGSLDGLMSTGRIQFAEQDGTFVLKFVGEVRLTLCSALDATIERIFTALNFSAIVIDLTETRSIDSTTLGLLAKLSILSRQKVGLLPTVVTTHEDITRLLQSMGFDQVFNIVDRPIPCPECLTDLPSQDQSEEVVRLKVLEAHKILMGLNESNREAFHDLVNALERH